MPIKSRPPKLSYHTYYDDGPMLLEITMLNACKTLLGSRTRALFFAAILPLACGKSSFEAGGSKTRTESRAVVKPSAGDAKPVVAPVDAGSEKPAVDPNRTLVGISIPSDKLVLKMGASAKVPVTATYSDQSTEDVTDKASFAPEKTDIVTIAGDKPGLLVGAGLGEVIVKISFADQTIPLQVSVVSLQIVSIAIAPAAVSVRVGESAQIQVVGTFEDEQKTDLTNEVTWSSDVPKVAIVDPAAAGSVLALSTNADQDHRPIPSQAVITAVYEKFSATVKVIVVPEPMIVDGEDVRVRSAAENLAGETQKVVHIRYLRKTDTVTAGRLSLHSVDLKPRDTAIKPHEALPEVELEGWYQQAVAINVNAKWVGRDHAARYNNQVLEYDIKFANGKKSTISAMLTWLTYPVDKDGNDIPSTPIRDFEATEGDPSAMPATFP